MTESHILLFAAAGGGAFLLAATIWALRSSPRPTPPLADEPPRALPPATFVPPPPAQLPRRLTGRRPAPILDIEMEYANLEGEVSERRVLVTTMDGVATEQDGIVSIERFAGLCLLRRAHRNFVVNRVQRARPAGTEQWLTKPQDIASLFLITAKAAVHRPEARLTRTEKRRARRAPME